MSAEDIERASAIRERAEQVKAELKAKRDAAPPDDFFLRGDREIVPSHSHVREVEGKPGWSRASGLFIANAPNPRKRKHRSTGKAVGRPGNGDGGLARAVYALMANRGVDRAAAVTAIAQWLTEIEPVKFKAARDRVYKALRH